MQFIEGQGILGKIRFVDGKMPQFLKPSFVKLDSLTKVDKSELEGVHILNNGRTLDSNELKRIKNDLM